MTAKATAIPTINRRVSSDIGSNRRWRVRPAARSRRFYGRGPRPGVGTAVSAPGQPRTAILGPFRKCANPPVHAGPEKRAARPLAATGLSSDSHAEYTGQPTLAGRPGQGRRYFAASPEGPV